MFCYQKISIKEGQCQKYLLYREEKRLSYRDFLELLRSEKTFRLFFIDILSQIIFRAYHWETPPVTEATMDQPFEFVVTNSPGIDLPSDASPFQNYFDESTGAQVAVFTNLGKDATLIAPFPSAKNLNYAHIGTFTRNAPREKQHELWQKTGIEAIKHISGRPIWLNTAGGGVAWLHVRLDSSPKYYRHREYAER